MLIKDVMTKNPICISESTSITEAIELMKKNNFSKLPVLDSSKRLVGILTKNDIAKVSPSNATTLDKYEIEALLSKLTCGKCMTKKVTTVPETQVVEEAAKLMVDKNIGCLPVLNDDVVVGIVTESDLFALFTNMFGARYSGVRVNFRAADKPGALAVVLSKIAEAGGNIVSVITREDEVPDTRRVTIRATQISEEKVQTILTACGSTVIDIRNV